MTWKPSGYTSVSPYLIVRDAQRAIDFMKAVFDAEALRIFTREDGKGIKHAEVRIDDTVIMLGEMPEGADAHIHVYLADPDNAMLKAMTAGAEVVQPMKRGDDGDYRGGFSDGQGVVWWVARQEGLGNDD